MKYVEKGYTYQDIANIFHITKGRVAQIVKAERQIMERRNELLSLEQ